MCIIFSRENQWLCLCPILQAVYRIHPYRCAKPSRFPGFIRLLEYTKYHLYMKAQHLNNSSAGPSGNCYKLSQIFLFPNLICFCLWLFMICFCYSLGLYVGRPRHFFRRPPCPFYVVHLACIVFPYNSMGWQCLMISSMPNVIYTHMYRTISG